MEIQDFSLPAFYCSRILGLEPYLITRNRNKDCIDGIRRSSWLCCYSICFMILTGACLTGAITGIVAKKLIQKLNANLRKVDDDLATFNIQESDKKDNLILVVFVYFVMSAMICLDIYSKWRNSNRLKETRRQTSQYTDAVQIESSLPFYMQYYILVGLHIELAVTALGVQRRYSRLNSALECFLLSKVAMNTTALEKATIILDQLSYTHAMLGEIVTIISTTFGMAMIMMMTACLFHLVATGYFLFIGILGEPDIFVACLQLLWCTFHAARLLLLVEPCHRATIEAKKTIMIVCEAIRIFKDSAIEPNLQRFLQQLIADGTYHFTACGLCTIDRQILTTISAAITTYLVILIQFQRTDK